MSALELFVLLALVAGLVVVIAPAVLAAPTAEAPAGAATSHGVLSTALAVTAAATVGFGLVAEPLLRLADRATMLT